jgi:two-component system chemotaxis sensor kinase CheA
MDAIDEIVAEFLVESHENLDQLDRDLLALEQDPTSRDLLASVFRTIHTIKGTSGFLAFHQLERLTHAGENLLSKLRDGRIQLTDDRASTLLRMVDVVRGLLGGIERTGAEEEVDFSDLIEQLAQLAEDTPPVAEPVTEKAAPPASRTRRAPAKRAAKRAPAKAKPTTDTQPSPAAAPEKVASPLIGDVLVQHGDTTADAVEVARMEQDLGDERRLGAILVDHGQTTPAAVAQALETQDARRSVVDSSVRVDVDLLDSLMRTVGELVLARNQLVSRLDGNGDTALARSAQRLSLVTSELQEQVMKTRMQPVDAVWRQLPRVVRDLAKQIGRQVRLEMVGRETELDRTILEAIKDPLTHLVRNAIDHGIEAPEVRVAHGKIAEGVLKLRAFHEAGQVHLEIHDDGAGIDPLRVAAKALENGLISQAQLATMSHRDIIQMIFLPGFSTAGQVTNVSGRGVGMDVVKTRIEGIGGSVDVATKLGQGSTFRLTIPLTLAIIPALTIGCAGRRYALPQVSVLELVRLNGDRARGGIELISGAPVYRLRDMLLPLVRLDEHLGIVPARHGDDDTASAEGTGGFIVVLQAEQTRFGLVVDEVLDTEEIVVKPLGRHLKHLSTYAGATILGDGAVVLILDASTLGRHAARPQGAATVVAVADTKATVTAEPVLVVAVGDGRRAAIPMETVTRLEEIAEKNIERVGGRLVVQYRGQIMPVVRLADLLGSSGLSGDFAETEGRAVNGLPVVVSTQGNRSVGLIVERILDIATEVSGTRSDIDDHALVGSVVIGDRVVELLDVQAAVLAADPHFYDVPEALNAAAAAAGVPGPEDLYIDEEMSA